MPANLIPLVTNSGRIFTANKVTPESDGLVGIIDLSERQKSHLPSEAVFNETGDGLLVADSRHQVTLLQISHNRFNVVAASLKETPFSACFTGKRNPQDQIMVVLKDQKLIQVYALNGKLLEQIQANLHHQLEIKSALACPKAGLIMTLSNDACVLWSSNQNATIKKERSLFAQHGCHFTDARFSPNGRQIGTLFRDGNLILWELDGISGLPNRPQDGQLSKYQFPSPQVKLFDIGSDMLVGAGPSFPYIVLVQLSAEGASPPRIYQLPNEARGVDQVGFLTDKLLLAYISEGIFNLVDIGQSQDSNKLQIALQIRLPSGSLIKRFSVDSPMNALAMTASNGHVLLHNLPAAIQNEQTLAKKRLQMGIEKELVHTYLHAVGLNSLQQRTAISDTPSSYGASSNSDQQSTGGFQNPFLTVPYSEGGRNAPSVLSQREGPTIPFASPLTAGQDNKSHFFSASNPQSQLASLNQQMHAMHIIDDQSSVTTNRHHLESEFQFPVPMPMSHASQSLVSSERKDHPFNNHLTMPSHESNLGNQQHPVGALWTDTNNPQATTLQPMHNISQSTVAGPYQQQSQRNSNSYRAAVHNMPQSQVQAQPIVQLSVPLDQRSVASGVTSSSKGQDYFISGLPAGMLPSQLMPSAASIEESTGQKFEHSIDSQFSADIREHDSAATAQFNMPKLRRLLKQYGQFPEKYRTLTWKFLLKLPLNKEAFQGLLNRGVHPAFKDLHKKFPVASYRLYNKLVRILSALGYWSPVFCDVSFLPGIVLPFLKAVPNDDLLVFELVMSLLVQWMQVWFEAHPAEPLSVCLAIDQILAAEDPRLAQHLRDMGFQASQYGWPILSQFFTESLAKEDWLKLVDHLFMKSEEPELLLYFLGGYLLSHKSQLLQIGCVEDLAVFLSQQTTVPFKKLLALTESLHAKLKRSIFPGNCGHNLPVSQQGSTYQSFTRYPEHFVQFQNRVREKIVNQEEEIQRKNEVLLDLKGKANEIIEQEHRMRLQQEAMARAEAERKTKVRTEMESLLQERIRLDELQRKARLEHIQAVEQAIKTSLTQQERLREEEHHQVQEEVSAIQRQQKYEFESRMQDEMIANLEFKANQKMLEQLQKQQQEEHNKQNREKLDSLHQEVLRRQKESMDRWEEQRAQTRTANQMLSHQLKVQAEQLSSNRERQFIEDKFSEVQQQRIQMEQLLSQQQQQREEETWKATELLRHKQEANRQLIQERERVEQERQHQEQQARAIQSEQAELERLKEQQELERQRLAQVTEERKNEVQMARQLREGNDEQDKAIAEERRRIQAEKDLIMQNRADLEEKQKTEIERRDFMKLIRTTAENVCDIVHDGKKQLELEREMRMSREAGMPQMWQQAQSQPAVADQSRSSEYQEMNVQDVITERERRVREQNESLREQLSLQYSQQMQLGEKENEGLAANGDQSSLQTSMLSATGFTLRQKHAQLMTPSSTTESHFTDESSDVESYHQSKMKKMTYSAAGPQAMQHGFYHGQSGASPLHVQTQLQPMNHQQLAAMPQSKSSIGEDISSSFVSSATESQRSNYQMMQQQQVPSMPAFKAAGGDMTDSMLTSSYDYAGTSQYSLMDQQQNPQQQSSHYHHLQREASSNNVLPPNF